MHVLINAKWSWEKWKARLKFSFHDWHSYHFIPHSSTISFTYHIKWHPLPPKFIKINFDGSKTNQGLATRLIRWAYTGIFLSASTSNLGDMSILVAEATTMRQGFIKPFNLGFKILSLKEITRSLFKQYGVKLMCHDNLTL